PLGPDSLPDGVEILRPVDGRQASVLTREALAFVADLQRRFGPGRERILAARADRWARLRAGEPPGFLPETAAVRNGDWQVAPAAPGLAPGRAQRAGRRRPRVGQPVRLRAVLLPQRPAPARAGPRPVLLPAEAGGPPRGPAVERRLQRRPGLARHRPGHDPGHRPHRDDPRRLRDGGDPLRAA